MRPLLLLLLAVLLAGPARAEDYRVDGLILQQPWARATIGNLRMTAGYLVIENGTAEPERLLGAASPRAQKIELHSVTDGMMRMESALDIPAGGSLVFAPGGYHLMLGPLDGPLLEGDRLPVMLTFERAGEITVEFEVEAANATAPD
jgi:hypothetical protein